MAQGSKISKHMEIEELPAFFRELADAIENGGEGEFACVDDMFKFKIKGNHEFGKIKIRAKFKTNMECQPPADLVAEDGTVTPAKPKYKDLKKRMRSSFNMLLKMIHDGEMPPDAAVVSFLEDSELMVSYPGYGDEFYESYTNACNDFKAAYEAKDMEKMHEAIDVLIHEKSRCHAKYD